MKNILGESGVIRNFLYSDSEKIRSISSQIFEGVSESFVLSKEESKSDSEEQKGKFASGRLLGDIFTQSTSSQELRFLEDFAYTLLEKKLTDDGLLQEISTKSVSNEANKSFIKINSKLHVNDLEKSSKTVRDFNEIGEAFWRVTNEQMNWSANQRILPDADVKKKAGEIGMQLNKKVAESATKLLEFGYGNLIETNMIINEMIFSAPLKRQFLRENEEMILHKYSRVSQSEFIMLGIVTYRGYVEEIDPKIPDVKDADGIKNAMRSLALHLNTFEKTFSAPVKNEIIIDPIAIYSVL